MKHYAFDIEEENSTAATRWARAAFGMSKPTGIKMSQMLWWRRVIYSYNGENRHGRPVTRFYFKREADLMMFKLKWS